MSEQPTNKNVIRGGFPGEAQTLAGILPNVAAIPGAILNKSRGMSTQQLIEETRQEASKEGFASGYEDGFRTGLEKGRIQGRDEAFAQAYTERTQAEQVTLSEFTTDLDELVDKIQVALNAWVRQAEESMTDLAMNAVRDILRTELSMSRDSCLELVKYALREVTHSTHARIRLNPFDSAILNQHRSELIAATASIRSLELVDDPTIEGGCVIETEGGIIDATVETHLELLEEHVGEAA